MSQPILQLLRRWAVDWLASADPAVCSEILAPSYRILIGGHVLDGRDAYIRGTVEQLNRFPGLGLTVHQVVWSGQKAAVRFTEHGAAARLGLREAAWQGVALFRSDGERLTECAVEEDYFSRRRQLDADSCDSIEPPAASPWTTREGASDERAEAAVKAWLDEGGFTGVELDRFPGVRLDDSWQGRDARVELVDPHVKLDAIFSSGNFVAFHGRVRGRCLGGLGGGRRSQPSPAILNLGGLVTVDGGRVTAGSIIRDRLGLQRSLGLGEPRG